VDAVNKRKLPESSMAIGGAELQPAPLIVPLMMGRTGEPDFCHTRTPTGNRENVPPVLVAAPVVC
jgi:hypothetical protein